MFIETLTLFLISSIADESRGRNSFQTQSEYVYRPIIDRTYDKTSRLFPVDRRTKNVSDADSVSSTNDIFNLRTAAPNPKNSLEEFTTEVTSLSRTLGDFISGNQHKLAYKVLDNRSYNVQHSDDLKTIAIPSSGNIDTAWLPDNSAGKNVKRAQTIVAKEAVANVSNFISEWPADEKKYSSSTVVSELSYEEITKNGLDNACYPDHQHYLAEYLYQTPDACFWKVDASNERVIKVEVPAIPDSAIKLPAPSGVDDTAALEDVINNNPGSSVYGVGTYSISNLEIRVPINIFNLRMVPAKNAGRIVNVKSPDVRIFNSPIDASGSNSVYSGYFVNAGADRFVLINSGFSNMHHTEQKNAAGVIIKGADDFHIACNTFDNLVNDTSDESKTARANAIWMTGGNSESTSGGIIANNSSENLQSNGAINDAEFFTSQGWKSTDNQKPVRIYANRTINAGKRLTKHQADDAVVLSNSYHWRDATGPLGQRTQYAMINVQFSSNVIVRNNRLKVSSTGGFDYIFHANAKWAEVEQDNLHFDCNDIEINNNVLDNHKPVHSQIIAARNSAIDIKRTDREATNSSAKNNVVHGEGGVGYFYWFGPGYSDTGGAFDTSGNKFNIRYTGREYK